MWHHPLSVIGIQLLLSHVVVAYSAHAHELLTRCRYTSSLLQLLNADQLRPHSLPPTLALASRQPSSPHWAIQAMKPAVSSARSRFFPMKIILFERGSSPQGVIG
jgi:hypothetical protein